MSDHICVPIIAKVVYDWPECKTMHEELRCIICGELQPKAREEGR